jgi:outer membrane protein assembly factor BamB
MTKLWQSVEGRADPADSLAVARQVIGEIENEPAFAASGEGEGGVSQAKQDVGPLLVRIGQALVDKAEKSTDQAEIEETTKHIAAVLQLSANDKYVPEQYRNAPALAAIQDALAVIQSRQQRDVRLAATLRAMDAAIARGDTAAAYAERLTLLSDFPALADEESLAAKVREASATEQARVKFLTDGTPAQTRWPERAVVAELALAERRAPANAAASGAPVVIRVDGALYGLRSGDGALLWRRFAGFGETSAPLIVDDGVVAADLAGGELWRLDAATGKLDWRLPLGDRITGVLATGPRLLATSESGRLFVVDAASGTLIGHVELAQPLYTAPAVNDRGDRVYVTGEHSIIYTLNTEDFSCLGVYYLGHNAGAIVAPPLVVLNKVIVADNSGTEACRVRVLSLDNDGAIAGEAASHRLTGLVITPLATAARRIAAATTRGEVGVFEVSAADDQSSFTVVAWRPAQDAEPLARFVLMRDGKLWLGANQLQKLTILPTENRLSVESTDNDYAGDAFDAPLQTVDQFVIHVRRPIRQAGAAVAAVDAATNREAWDTHIAVPPAGAPSVDTAHMLVTAATASGAAYVLDREALVRGVQDETVRTSLAGSGAPPLTQAIDLGQGQLAAAAAGGKQLVLVRKSSSQPSVRNVELVAPLGGPLAVWGSHIVCPTDAGQVFAMDAATGAPACTPFQPKLTPDRKFLWLGPAVAGAGDQSRLLVSDGAERLYLVRQVAEPVAHLDEEKSVDVGPSPLASPLAVVGNRVVAGTEDGRLAAFTLPELTPREPIDLGGRIAWGPFSVEGGVLFSTDAGELMMVGPDSAFRWRRKIEHGDLAGQPLLDGGNVLLLHANGGLSQVTLSDGAEAGYAAVGQPAVAGPVPLGGRVIVAAPDGALLVVNRP